VVAKDKCFYFAHSEAVDDEGEKTETKSHFDFGLYGNLNGDEYSMMRAESLLMLIIEMS
jgi:hypothetical protein